MINYKPNIVRILQTVHTTVRESFPDDWSVLPVILYEEEQNEPYSHTTAGETQTVLRYRIDIYSTASTSTLKTAVDSALTDVGFTRVFSQDVRDPGALRHSVLRYEAVYDHNNQKLYRNA